MNAIQDHIILLAEDDPDDVALVRRAIKKANIANPVQVVSDGEQVVQYLSGAGPYADRQQYPIPSLVLLDLKMPKKSGLEVLEWIRRQPILKRLLVVVLTSSRETPDINKAYDLGVNAYLVKPVSFEALQEMIQRLNLFFLLLTEKPDLDALL